MLIQPDGPALSVPMEGLQQPSCRARNVNCPVITSSTLVLPYDLQVPTQASAESAMLRIFENDTAVGDIPLHPISDFVHILNSCDQTPIYIGALLYASPAPGCRSVVQHANGDLVTSSNPASPGELLILNAYGLGVIKLGVPFSVPVGSFNLTYAFLTNASPRRGSPGPVVAASLYWISQPRPVSGQLQSASVAKYFAPRMR